MRRAIQRLICGALLIAAISFAQGGPATAQVRGTKALVVSFDMGGSIGVRQAKIRQLRRQDQRVVIKGRCYSACTMYLGLRNVCIEPNAVFGFHGPQGLLGTLSPDVFEHWSRVMAKNLHPDLQSWFMTRARYVKSGVLKISGTTLIDMGYKQC